VTAAVIKEAELISIPRGPEGGLCCR